MKTRRAWREEASMMAMERIIFSLMVAAALFGCGVDKKSPGVPKAHFDNMATSGGAATSPTSAPKISVTAMITAATGTTTDFYSGDISISGSTTGGLFVPRVTIVITNDGSDQLNGTLMIPVIINGVYISQWAGLIILQPGETQTVDNGFASGGDCATMCGPTTLTAYYFYTPELTDPNNLQSVLGVVDLATMENYIATHDALAIGISHFTVVQ